MCRFLAYKGKKVLIADILTRPSHSLIKQSYCAKMREEPLNGDGFGLGWYDHELDSKPGLFTSLTPAWGNRNLYRLAEKLKSNCIFAHIRAATPGMLVNEVNCHPFQYKNLLWMHNGFIRDFTKIKRKLRSSLKDPYYHMIEGTTDSEHAFALFLNFLPSVETTNSQTLKDAMLATISQLKSWEKEFGINEGSNYNFAVTDGENIVVTRYASFKDKPPETLYFIQGSNFHCENGVCLMENKMNENSSIIVSSEPLTEEINHWQEIQPNTLMEINANNEIKSYKIE